MNNEIDIAEEFSRQLLEEKIADTPVPSPGSPMFKRLKRLKDEGEAIRERGGEKIEIDFTNPHNKYIALTSGYHIT